MLLPNIPLINHVGNRDETANEGKTTYVQVIDKMERETGFEPATLALARRCSTTELFPLDRSGLVGGGFY